MRFSYQPIPEQPLEDLVSVIELIDQLGFWACFSAYETYHKDMCITSETARRGRSSNLAARRGHLRHVSDVSVAPDSRQADARRRTIVASIVAT